MLKYDEGKDMFHLIPLEPFEALAKVFTFGYNKYANGNPESGWKEVENAVSRYESAMWRHWVAHKKGEITDKESGYPHLYHFLWNAYVLTWFFIKGKGE